MIQNQVGRKDKGCGKYREEKQNFRKKKMSQESNPNVYCNFVNYFEGD